MHYHACIHCVYKNKYATDDNWSEHFTLKKKIFRPSY